MLSRNALTPLWSLRRDIDRLWEDTFGATDNGSRWMPAADIRETEKSIRFDFELPGLKPEQVEITAENGILTVRGEKQEERTEGEEGSRFHLVERNYGSFTRSFQLPNGVDDEKIAATFENGVLRIEVPKAAVAQPRRIQIGTSASPRVEGTAKSERSRGENARGENQSRREKTVQREPASEGRA